MIIMVIFKMSIFLMPRRVPDYPDAFEGWNWISSIGSLISVLSMALFLYIIYDMFRNQKAASANPWGTPSFFMSTPSYENETQVSTSLEWGIPSPTPFHRFQMLPKQS
jgi:cytochrome c oxidase subunit 1